MESGVGAAALQTLFALVVVCGAAVAILRGLAPRVRARGKAMEVLDRLQVEPGRSLVVVRVASRTLLLGSSDAGIVQIADLTEEASAFRPEQAAADVSRETSPGRVLRETWRRLVSRETSEVRP